MLILNRGQAILSTDYWDSKHAQAGAFFLSWNAGAARLLIPDSQKSVLREMKGASEVIVSRGPWIEHGRRDALELLWEDDSDSPFAIHLVAEQTDRLIPESDQGAGLTVSAWTRNGIAASWPARYRLVERIPWLRAWEEH